MRRFVVVFLLLASSSAFAGPMTGATAINTAVSHSVMTRSQATKPLNQVFRFTGFKYGLLKWCHTGPREAEQGDLTF